MCDTECNGTCTNPNTEPQVTEWMNSSRSLLQRQGSQAEEGWEVLHGKE